MLDYNPSTKLYRVKRVHVPAHVMEAAQRRAEREKEEETVAAAQDAKKRGN